MQNTDATINSGMSGPDGVFVHDSRNRTKSASATRRNCLLLFFILTGTQAYFINNFSNLVEFGIDPVVKCIAIAFKLGPCSCDN